MIVKLIPSLYTHNHKVSLYYKLIALMYFVVFLDGLIYFVRGDSIGSDFGFPRLGVKKVFKW